MHGEGAKSASLAVTPMGPPDTPPAPTITQSGADVTISWTELSDTGSPITAHELALQHSDQSWVTLGAL